MSKEDKSLKGFVEEGKDELSKHEENAFQMDMLRNTLPVTKTNTLEKKRRFLEACRSAALKSCPSRIPNETTESSSEYDDELSFLAESLSIQEQDSKRIKFMPYII